MFTSFRPSYCALPLPLRCFIVCRNHSLSSADHLPQLTNRYRESFAKRMAMAGIQPHHRIALGVSGGPDSMALCVLTAGWKLDGLGAAGTDSSGHVDGLVGIVVDHQLRPESNDEAHLVQDRVAKMGIRCVIECCDWSGGKPKLGHLQETARNMRYQIFQRVCIKQSIGILLIAHHTDDQIELFLLRLSRNSGVLGLAGMAFVSQVFPTDSHCCCEGGQGILLVRPMLEFVKDDMYRICEAAHQEWVEDPTNQCPLFARNRLRMSLKNISSNIFRSEMRRLIGACQLTRTYIDTVSHEMIEHCVTITEHGYAVIDLEKLEPINMEDLRLSKFLATILQFISQRHKPVRGSALQLLLDYIRTFPCKTSFTAAGCYLSASPRSKGTKVLVCSHDSPHSSTILSSHKHYQKTQPVLLPEIDQIIYDAKSYSGQHVPEVANVHFLHAKSSEDVLDEAKKFGLISELTFSSMWSLQMEEHKNFSSKTQGETSCAYSHEKTPSTPHIRLHPGESCHFMSRFLVTWEVCEDVLKRRLSSSWKDNICQQSSDHNHLCQFCMAGEANSVGVRHMIDADWLYLAEVLNRHSSHGFHGLPHASGSMLEKNLSTELECQPYASGSTLENLSTELDCSSYMQLSAKKALQLLKSIPASARRALPVVVNSHGLPLSIPSICFSCCPHLSVTTVFKPRVPLGGGYSSYI